MNLEKMYDLIEKENINVKEFSLENVSAFYLNYVNTNIIALNHDLIDSNTKEKEILSHELGHYYFDASYFINADKITKDKAEYKANKFSYSILTPLPKIKEYVNLGYSEVAELADKFDVSYEYMQNSLKYYGF